MGATTDPDDLAAPDDWLTGMMRAPVVVVPCSSKAAYLSRYAQPDKGWTDRDEARWPMPFWHMDAAMASLLILQTAVDEGLGACFFGIPPERDSSVRAAFGIPDTFDPVGVVTIGHLADDAATPARPARRRASRPRRGRAPGALGRLTPRQSTGPRPRARIDHPRRVVSGTRRGASRCWAASVQPERAPEGATIIRHPTQEALPAGGLSTP